MSAYKKALKDTLLCKSTPIPGTSYEDFMCGQTCIRSNLFVIDDPVPVIGEVKEIVINNQLIEKLITYTRLSDRLTDMSRLLRIYS